MSTKGPIVDSMPVISERAAEVATRAQARADAEATALDALPADATALIEAKDATAPLLLEPLALTALAKYHAEASPDASPAEIAAALVAKGVLAPADQRDVQRSIEGTRRRLDRLAEKAVRDVVRVQKV